MDDLRAAWIRIGLAEGIGPRTWGPLVERLGSPLHLVRMSVRELSREVRGGHATRIADALKAVDVDAICRRAAGLGQSVATPADDDWPHERLQALPDPPSVLFRSGPFPDDAVRCVALVGTRAASRYGLEVARTFGGELAGRGACVVSGFAVGVDAAAHQGALDAAGHTLAALGTGLDVRYPVANAALRLALQSGGGTFLSEHPPGTRARRFHFPRRNRLVAALADVVVVIEAPRRSGALITARIAGDLGRDVLAVPGHIGRRSQRGAHALIKQGAGLCESVDDILDPLGPPTPSAPSREPEPGPGYDVWQQLDLDEAQDLDTLVRMTGLGVGALLSALAALELDGFAHRVPGAGYVRGA